MSVSNTSLPPKRQSSRRGLVLFAVVAGAGLGALAFVLSRSKAAPPPAPVAFSEPARVVKDVPPPPPPPPPEVVEAPAVVASEEAKLPAKPAVGRSVPCSGECSGRETPELASALRGRAGQSRSCYERALSSNSALTGRLIVTVRVTPQGSVCSANVSQDSLGDPGVTRCVVQRFLTGTYPKPTGGCVELAVPINFVPRQ